MQFNLIKEEGKEIEDLIIEERGQVNKFTWSDFLQAEKANKKQREQIKAQVEMDEAVKTNIETFHPFILELTKEQLHTATLYKQTIDQLALYKAKLELFEEADKRDSERRQEILKQIPELN